MHTIMFSIISIFLTVWISYRNTSLFLFTISTFYDTFITKLLFRRISLKNLWVPRDFPNYVSIFKFLQLSFECRFNFLFKLLIIMQKLNEKRVFLHHDDNSSCYCLQEMKKRLLYFFKLFHSFYYMLFFDWWNSRKKSLSGFW